MQIGALRMVPPVLRRHLVELFESEGAGRAALRTLCRRLPTLFELWDLACRCEHGAAHGIKATRGCQISLTTPPPASTAL